MTQLTWLRLSNVISPFVPTNDCSEGDLGCFRLFAREHQTKNTLLYNANRQYHENETAAWEDHIKKPANFYSVVLKEARRRLDSRESEIVLERIAAATETRALAHRTEREQGCPRVRISLSNSYE